MDIRYHLSGLAAWLRLLRRHGRPDLAFHFNGGIGDQLLCSAVARELMLRRPRNVWLFTQVPELFDRNPDFRYAGPMDLRLVPWLRVFRRPLIPMYYQAYEEGRDRDAPLHEPSIAALCRRAGINGEVTLRPQLASVNIGLRSSRTKPRIAIHSSCLSARYPIPNKQWPLANLTTVATELASITELLQFGHPSDPKLPAAVDKRGLPLLDVARLLSDCDLFVVMVGFLMHLARAVECPSVIVYGGREPPEITGYSCNTNLSNRPPCAPCWQYSRCGYDRICLSKVTPASVVEAVHRMLADPPLRPLKADTYVINSA